MTSNKILSADLLDLVFDGRNKEYGAYELRKSYNNRITKSLLVTAGITVFAFGVVLARPIKEKEEILFKITPVIEMANIDDEPDPLPPPLPPRQEPPIRTEIWTTPQIVESVDGPPPSIDVLENARIDVVKTDGVNDTGLSVPTSLDGNTGIIETPPPVSNDPLTTVQIQAKFKGDWAKFLLKYLRGETPINNGAPAGRYKVMIRFVVDMDGSVSDITPLTNIGFGMEEEAIRVIKKSDKWEPAIQNGYAVKAYRMQPVVFDVGGE